MSRLLFLTIVTAAFALCAAATAGECHHFFQQAKVVQVVQHHAQAVVVAPVHHAYVAPQILYQAGQYIEAEAIAEKAALRALAKFTAYQQQSAVRPQVATPPPVPAAENIVAEKCGKCHSGAAPKAGLTLDGVTGLPCDAITASLRAIKDDKMPKRPDAPLTPEEKGLLMEALLALESK